MTRTQHAVLACFVATMSLPLPALAQQANVPISEHTLDNGMKLLLVERHHSPTVSGGWVAHVGSANETYGITGIAHLFEHMMFKGTPIIGTTDFALEQELMAELDAIRFDMEKEYAALREAKRRGEINGSIYLPDNQTERLTELRAKMRALQDRQRKVIVKEELDQIYSGEGASGVNAFTNQDMTAYFVTVPANKLELWFWLESDRLLNPVFREFYSERDVVREERRSRVESDPQQKFEEQFDAMFWTATPYHHPVIGWPSDVESINRQQADRFFSTYYAPNNLTVALVGDFDTKEVLRLANGYFGRIPRGRTDPPDVVTEEIEQLAPRRTAAEAEANPSVTLRWHAVSFVHPDSYALDILSDILSGRTGRLYRGLVEESQLAAGEPYADVSARKYAGSFEMGAELADGVSHDRVEAALLAEVERLKNEPVGERELQKVKNQSLADSFRRLQSNFFLMLQLLIYDALGDPTFLNESPARLQAVSAEDVTRVAETYMTNTGLNALWYSRVAGTEEDPGLAALEGQAKAFAQQGLAQIAGTEDADQLSSMITQLETARPQVPAELAAAVDLLIARANERLTALSAGAAKEE